MSEDTTWLNSQDIRSIEAIARVAHAAVCAYAECLGEHELPWDCLAQWQRDGKMAGVRRRLRYPGAPIKSAREYWNATMRSEGWTYGAEKCDDAKTHPELIEWVDLPVPQKLKDYLYVSVILTMAADIELAEREQAEAA